jgi:UDP-N-acetyl-2-amino-2-deoxyglucuronate dehydrogenase
MQACEDKVRFAVVGYGHIGRRHAAMIKRHPEAELTALIDTNREVLNFEELAIPLYSSLADALRKDVAAEVFVIATPNGLHAAHALAALEAGKHIIIEKPMALRKKDAEEIIRKATEVQRQALVVMQNRYSGPSVWIKQMADSGKLGKIFLVQVNCFWNRDGRYYRQDSWHGTTDLDGGILYTQFSHFVDILFWLLGDLDFIDKKLKNYNHQYLAGMEDSGMVLFQFGQDGIGSLNFTTAAWDRNLESSLTIIAENGSIKLSGQYMTRIEYCHVKDYVLPPEMENPGTGDPVNNHYRVIADMIDLLKGRSGSSGNAVEGLKVVSFIEKIYGEKN